MTKAKAIWQPMKLNLEAGVSGWLAVRAALSAKAAAGVMAGEA